VLVEMVVHLLERLEQTAATLYLALSPQLAAVAVHLLEALVLALADQVVALGMEVERLRLEALELPIKVLLVAARLPLALVAAVALVR
jgi:hypothetical protein